MISYSFAWAILGTLFLVAGILRHSPLLRWASLILMFAAIIKVFIFDMADLRDLLRVLSFAGLGLSLMALAVSTSTSSSASRRCLGHHYPPERRIDAVQR